MYDGYACLFLENKVLIFLYEPCINVAARAGTWGRGKDGRGGSSCVSAAGVVPTFDVVPCTGGRETAKKAGRVGVGDFACSGVATRCEAASDAVQGSVPGCPIAPGKYYCRKPTHKLQRDDGRRSGYRTLLVGLGHESRPYRM